MGGNRNNRNRLKAQNKEILGARLLRGVSPRRTGKKISSGSSEASVTVTVDGAGTKQGQGSTEATVTAIPEGEGVKATEGGSTATVTVTAEGAGVVPTAEYLEIQKKVNGEWVALSNDYASPYEDEGPFADSITYYYRARKWVDGNYSRWIEVSLAYDAEYTNPSGGSTAEITVTADGAGIKKASGVQPPG